MPVINALVVSTKQKRNDISNPKAATKMDATYMEFRRMSVLYIVLDIYHSISMLFKTKMIMQGKDVQRP